MRLVLEVENAIKIFKHRRDNSKIAALNGCDLFIAKGEIASIIGPSGAGKTTLLRVISGTEALSSGKIIINGFEIQDWDERKRREFRKKFIGTFSQHSRDNLDPKHLVEEAIRWELMHAEWPSKDISSRIDELLIKLNLSELKNTRCGNLSAGEAMRVSLAKAIAKKPFLILADEPTGQLDTANMQLLYQLMREIAKDGTSICVATHDIRFQSLSDKTYLIMDGKLASEEEGVELLFHHALKTDELMERTVFVDTTKSIRLPQSILEGLQLNRKALLKYDPKSQLTTIERHPQDEERVVTEEKIQHIDLNDDFRVPTHDGPAVQITDLHKSYFTNNNENKVLNGIKLDVKKGEFVVLLGPSGIGKSTLITLLGGLDTVSSGELVVNGYNITENTSFRNVVRQSELSYLSQNYILHPYLTVRENIELPNSLVDTKTTLDVKKLRKYLQFLEISEYEYVYPTELSGGQKQRVALLGAILKDAPILLADEPTANLDSILARKVMDLLEQLVALGKTLVVATHDLTLIKPGFRIIRMNNGLIYEDVIADEEYCNNLEREFLQS